MEYDKKAIVNEHVRFPKPSSLTNFINSYCILLSD